LHDAQGLKRLEFVTIWENGPTAYARWRTGNPRPNSRIVSKATVEMRVIVLMLSKFFDLAGSVKGSSASQSWSDGHARSARRLNTPQPGRFCRWQCAALARLSAASIRWNAALSDLPGASMSADLTILNKDQQIGAADKVLFAVVEIKHVQTFVVLLIPLAPIAIDIG